MSQACDRCHSRKVRCDRELPCRRCAQSGLSCTYTDRSKERLYRQDQVDALESKIRRLEERNRSLLGDLSRIRARSNSQSRVSLPEVAERPSSTPTTAGGFAQHLNFNPAQRSDVISEVSYLTIDAAGESHYLGSASGVLLAKFVRANVDADGTLPRAEAGLHRSGEADQCGIPAQDRASRAKELPSASSAKRIVVAYLRHDHLCYPIFSPSYVLKILQDTYSDANYYALHKFESFVLDMILAIGTIHMHKSDSQVLPSAESHHVRALASLSDILQLHGIQSLQAILLVTQYRMGKSSVHGNSASMWHLVGIATRIALQLGLHRESAYPIVLSADWETGPDRDKIVHQETVRRCFWSTIAMDRIISNVLGRPLAIRSEDIDTVLPTTSSDDVMSSGIGDLPCSELVDLQGRAAIFIHITEYRLLCGKIVATMHGPSSVGSDPGEARLRRETIAGELRDWRQRMDNIGLNDDNSSAVSCFRSRTWFEMIYHNAVLMLYRPSPHLDISGDGEALRHIFLSAQQSIQLYAALHRSQRLNHSWLTLQAVFMSGLSYVYAVGSHFRQRRRIRSSQEVSLLENDPTMMEIVNDTRACSNVLVAVSESWNSLRHYTDVFNRLSDAVLADVIKFQSNSRSIHASEAVSPSERTDPPVHFTHQAGSSDSAPSSWTAMHQEPLDMGNPSPASVLAVDMAFQNSFEDLQFLYNQEHVDYSIYQLSQSWFDNFDMTTD